LCTDTVSDDDDTETFEKHEIYLKMLDLDLNNLPERFSIQKRVNEFETEA